VRPDSVSARSPTNPFAAPVWTGSKTSIGEAGLYDTNILLDVILNRVPHVNASAAALDLVGQGLVEGCVAGHAVTTIAYLVQREKSAAEAHKALVHLLARVRVAPITDASIRVALVMGFGDLEDAVCAASAQEANCALIVTRNPQHFRESQPPAMLPEALLALPLESADS
jgi:predicted nucleic acid-binding protein